MTIELGDPSRPSKRLNHLLAAARQAFMKQGYQHVSVDGLARASGVSKETIYRYFSDKQALFRAAMKNASEQFAHDFSGIFHEQASPEEILARCARVMYERTADTENPTPNWLAVGVVARFPDLSRAVFYDTMESMAPLQKFLQQLAHASGSAKPISFDILAQFGALAVAGPLHIMGGLPPSDVEGAARRVARLFLHGCGSGLDGDTGTELPEQVFSPRASDPAPILEAHITQLMGTARSHFYEHGYRGASLDEIGHEARVGRGTLYRHFGNKKGLFQAVTLQAADELMARPQLKLSTARPITENLLSAANAASAILQDAEAIRLYRTVSAEAKAMPEIARDIHDRTRTRLVQPLGEYLGWCASKGLVSLDSPAWAADQFITLATGGNRYLILDPPPLDAERAANAELAVSTFLYGFLGK